MGLSKSDFDFVSQLARQQAAIVLEPGKEYLVEARLSPLARKEGFHSLQALISQMRSGERNGVLHHKAIDALTTNETSFFRDFHPFESLRQSILPSLLEKRASTRSLTIWSAACSSGQEPYSLAMLLQEHFPQLSNWSVSILATDLSPTVLAYAREGQYSQLEVNRGLPANYLVKYFSLREGKWSLRETIKKRVHFRLLNLVQGWPAMPAFDLVMLRNVLIYFNVETKQAILGNIRRQLAPHGHLFLGAAETTVGLDAEFQPVSYGKTVAYCLK